MAQLHWITYAICCSQMLYNGTPFKTPPPRDTMMTCADFGTLAKLMFHDKFVSEVRVIKDRSQKAL